MHFFKIFDRRKVHFFKIILEKAHLGLTILLIYMIRHICRKMKIFMQILRKNVWIIEANGEKLNNAVNDRG